MIVASIPGPVDRVHFLDEQQRRRRQSWRFAALAALAAAVFGIPLAMFLTPMVFLGTIGALRFIERFVAVPDGAWSPLRDLAQFVPTFLDTATDDMPETDVLPWLQQAVASADYPFGSPLLTLAALILPGMAAMMLIWLGVRTLFRRAGVGGSLLALGAREPRLDDLQERQLVNLVEEMALAAGLPALRVQMIDSSFPNAAVVGPSHDKAVLIVTRGLLDQMDRDETQGVIAHLLASTGNGDLGLLTSITTVFQALELVFTVAEALFNLSQSAWRDLWWMLRLTVTGGKDNRAAEMVARTMDHRIGESREDGLVAMLGDERTPRRGVAKLLKALPPLWIVFFPFLILYVLALLLRMQVAMFRLAFVAPLLMRVARTRRFLADATAVELTRYPDGLARALAHLAEDGGPIPGGQWFSHLFIVGCESVQARNDRAVRERLAGLRETMGTREGGLLASAADARQAIRAHSVQTEEMVGKTWAGELAGVPSHPSILARMHRLGALGAQAHDKRTRSPGPRMHTRASWSMVVVAPLLAIAAVLSAVAFSMILMIGVLASVAFMGLGMAGIQALLA